MAGNYWTDPEQVEAIIAKQRNGPTPTIKLTWIRHCARFDSYQGE